MGQDDSDKAIEFARSFAGIKGLDLAKEVTTKAPYVYDKGQGEYHVVAYDFGIKKTILDCLQQSGCKITVVPATTSAQSALALSLVN